MSQSSSGSGELLLPLTAHLQEMRQRLILSLLATALALIITITFWQPLFHLLADTAPVRLTAFTPLEGFTTTLLCCLWAAVALSMPVWLIQVLLFIAPALSISWRSRLIALFIGLLFMLFAGSLTAYWVTIPLATSFFYQFNALLGDQLWGLSDYIRFTMVLIAGHAIAFQIVGMVYLAIFWGIIPADTAWAYRRHWILCSFILGALLTPPDVFTQLCMASFLIMAYEGALLIARIRRYNA